VLRAWAAGTTVLSPRKRKTIKTIAASAYP
jgi:hypothetical protein